MSELTTLRRSKDDYMAQDPHSPLTDNQKHGFNGLDYFPENTDLNILVNVDQFQEKAKIQMQTSTGDFQSFQRFGNFKFSMEGEAAELTIYVNEHGFFLPFVDSLAGDKTYPAGRYLDPEPQDDGKFLVDFNQAYNPYCAYNDRWSCPFPPAENRIQVPVRAGEKIFKDHN